MRTPAALCLGLVAGVVLGGAGMAIVDEDEPARAPSGPADELTAHDCGMLIPDSALDALGWQAPPAAVEIDDFRCLREGGAGSVTVDDLAVVADAEEREQEAREVFDEACTVMGADVVRDPAWLEGSDTCVTTELRAGLGQAEIHVLTEDDQVMRIHVVMRERTSPQRLRDGLGELVAAVG